MTYTPNTYTDFKNSVRVASTGNVNVSSPGASIDGIALTAGNRVLLKDQSTPAQNGTYNWMGAAVPMVRAKDADQSGELTPGAASYIEQGTVNGKKTFTLTTTGAIVVGTTPLVYEELTPTLANSFLADLGDVDTTGVGAADMLYFDGANWVDTTTLSWSNTGGAFNLSGTTPGIWMEDQPSGAAFGAFLVTDSTLFQVQKRNPSFGTVVDTPFAIDLSASLITLGSAYALRFGTDVQMSRTAANILSMAAGDKIQQNAAPTVNDDLVNKLYVDNEFATFSTDLAGLDDVDITGVVDGSLLRYEGTGTVWNDTTALLFSDAGQLQVTTSGVAAGIMLGGDAQLYRGAANVITVGAGDKIQQNAAPTVNDDLTNKLYVDTEILAATPDFDQAFRRSWFGVG